MESRSKIKIREALAMSKMNGVKLGRPKGSSQKKVMFYKKKDEINYMIQQGKTIAEIALSIGIHRNTLSRYLKNK